MERIEQFETVLLPGYRRDDEEPGKLYVVTCSEVAEKCGPSVSFFCPCGCGKEVWLPCNTPAFNRHSSPSWGLTVNPDGTVTLTPSILDRGPCQSHYFITNSRVSWC